MSNQLKSIVGDVRPTSSMRPTSNRKVAAALHIKIALPRAKVLVLPGRFRSAEYIRTHVKYVVAMGAIKGEQHIIRNLGAIERVLREMGVDKEAISAELRTIEGQVRAELWRQILTPESGDA